MRIKKVSQISGYVGTVSNSYSGSTTDTYSCNYLNNKVDGKVSKTGDTMTGNLSITGDMTSTSLQGHTWDYSTENTIDSWVPVSTGNGKWQHRVIPLKLTEKLDYYNDTSASDVKEWLRNKISLVVTQLADVEHGMMFLNGGWAGVSFAFGIGAKLNTSAYMVVEFLWGTETYVCTYDANVNSYGYNVYHGSVL